MIISSVLQYLKVSEQRGDLKQQLVFGDSLDRFKEVGVQTKFMFQFLLAFLK